MLPHDFPHHGTVYKYFQKWERLGIWKKIFEEDLAQDVLEIITVFSARLYGSRSHKNKTLVKELREVADKIK